MINVLIVDDEPLARERIAGLLAGRGDLRPVGECANGPEALEAIRRLRPDLVFLDVQMPGLNGFEVLAELAPEEMPEVVFVTAYDQYALQAFAAHALDYLLKPFDNERFAETLDFARRRLAERAATHTVSRSLLDLLAQVRKSGPETYLARIPVRQNQRILFVDVREVVACEAEGSYVRIRTAEASHLIRQNLGQLEKQLNPQRFARIHRSVLVRTDAIRELQTPSPHEWLVVLKNGVRYTVGRNFRDKVRNLLQL